MQHIVLLIILVTCIISYKGFEDRTFFNKYKFHIGSIRSGEQIRMISSGFLHADWVHLLLNMYVLYSFSQGVISTFGNFSFLLIYFGSLLFGSLLTLTIYKNDYSYSAVGASGAVTGIVYASILLFPESTVGVFFLLPMPSYVFGVLYLVYSIYGMKAQNDGIGHAAHFGGAVGGLVLTVIKMPELLQIEPLLIVGLLVPIGILYFLMKQGKL
ncbi:rhomboid family protein [Flavobacterium croceum DSM 17960]|uniref:Rhomboid family protein n=1 Tax=Flavobacterium croceum DSM 17960 TaxID=1121886 RepID=A0A2S4N7K4_9FLAO|nr:rhomboid family intramembrane serine protease [Flavobacterium croceum]POS01692.1 rhomboid family protein [Flavobacterium croceum DSM 17960]